MAGKERTAQGRERQATVTLDWYDTRVQVVNGEIVGIWLRHVQGESGHKDTTICGTMNGNFAVVNTREFSGNEPPEGLAHIPLGNEALQILINDLWYHGLRPDFELPDQGWRWPNETNAFVVKKHGLHKAEKRTNEQTR